jgi:uncharacterized integral membrane protein
VSETVTVELEEDDLYAAFRLLGSSRRKKARPVILIALLLFILIVVLVVLFPEARFAYFGSPMMAALSGVAIFLLLVVALILAATRPLLRRAAHNSLHNHPGMSDPITYVIGNDDFTIRTTYGEATYPWGKLHGWREDARIVLILLTRQLFYVVPKHQIEPAPLELLRERLQGTGSHTAEPQR